MDRDTNLYDLIVVGAGPAGLSAAIYMARAKYRVLVLEKSAVGGQITITAEVVNYPGVERISGRKLTEKMRRQAESFGAEFAIAEVLDMELMEDVKTLHTTKGDYRCLGVILAPGANPRKLGFKGEREFQGRGVAYCATCDGEFFTDRDVFVIGGGFAAVEEGIFLTKYARSVTIVVREDHFTCAKTVSDKLDNQEKIKVVFETELVEAGGEQMLTYARFRNNRTKEEWIHKAEDGESFGIFVFAGYVPNTAWIGSEVKRDDRGYLLTDSDQKTSVEGVYAAGDVCVKNLRQVVTAVSDGAVAATSLEKVVSETHKRLNIPELWHESSRKTAYEYEDGEDKVHEVVEETEEDNGMQNGFLTEDIRRQLSGVFEKFARPVILRAWLDDSPLSGEVEGFLRELDGINTKVTWERAEGDEETGTNRIKPCVEVFLPDGKGTGIRFHGVPGGHEFNSFVIGLYNAAGPGQQIDETVEERLKNLQNNWNIKILVSLSCTMCPETVMAAQKAAALSEKVEAEMFDLAHFPALKEKYKVMSVPCMVVNDETLYFGKKGLQEISELIS